jgi:CubicO group peptidase (beta-lactamase class C family)
MHRRGWAVFGVFVLSTSIAPVAVAQQPGEISYRDDAVMPAGPAGARIRSLIDVFNSGDPARVQRFLEEECTERFRDMAPLEEHLSVFDEVRRGWGGVSFHSIRTYVPERAGQTVVIVQDSNYGAWRGITLRFDDSGEQRVDGVGFNDARPPTDVSEPALSESDLLREVRAITLRVCERDAFSGTILLARGERVLFTHACGEASKAYHVPNNIDTKFNLGSMNKMFTATAIAQLVERGVLSYQDTISKYVDESWLPRELTGKITVHHLLTHTSGLGSYFNETYWNGSRALYRELADFKPLVRGDSLAFEPGTQYSYSNTGMLLLGVVIESATGRSYYDYIRENIYAPAGMRNSDSYAMDEPVENLAIGYVPSRESSSGWRNNLFLHVIKGGPAGGGFSTVGDLHRYALAMLGKKLVSQATLDLMWADQSGTGYGYGFGVREGPAGKVVGHSGGFPGINGDLAIFVERGYIVAVLSNYSSGASDLSGRVQQMIGRVR